MDLLVECWEYWLRTLGWLGGLAAAFALLTRLTPCNPGMYWWKDTRAVTADFFYWFLMPLFLHLCRTLLLTAGIALLFGGKDPIADPAAAREFYEAATSKDKQMKLYDGLLHELAHEPERDLVFRDIVAWLEERAKTPAKAAAGK